MMSRSYSLRLSYLFGKVDDFTPAQVLMVKHFNYPHFNGVSIRLKRISGSLFVVPRGVEPIHPVGYFGGIYLYRYTGEQYS